MTNKEFTSYSNDIASKISAATQFPTFSFIDPFGIKDTPFETVSRLLSGDRSECFINFWAGWANRFIGHPDAVGAHVRSLLGGEYVDLVIQSADRIETIMEIYRTRLGKKARFVRPFQMLDEGNVRDNTLIFCGHISKGFVRMKEAMWRLDPEFGQRFSAFESSPGGQNQIRFALDANLDELRRELRSYMSQEQPVRCQEIFEWVDTETRFLRRHAKAILAEHAAAGRLMISDEGARKRRSNHWPDDLYVKFSNV